MDILDKICDLVSYLNEKTKEYDEGRPSISDEEWDNKYFELVKLEKETGIVMVNSPTQIINYEVVSELNKVEHNHKMLSLDKTKDWNQFLNYFEGKDVIGMLKLDGLTCSLCYENGVLVSAETRGNGIIGENILHNARVIESIPKRIPYRNRLVVDGEIICTKKDFEPFMEEYANQRNFASGSIRLLNSAECARRHLTFVAWNLVEGYDESSFLNCLSFLEKTGFIVVPWTSSFDWDAKEFLINTAEELGYPIDGLVGRFDDLNYGMSLGSTGHHSRAAYAFKFYDEEYETTLKNIEWTMGRTGVLTPVAIFESIDDGESVIERASLHNVSILKETLHYPFFGQKIKVFKANQIIPQISWAEEADLATMDATLAFSIVIPDTCPVCGEPAEIVESETGILNLVCGNPQCQGKLINRLDHFCGKKGLDIKGLSKATLEKLITWGWVSSIDDIFTLDQYKDEWIKKPGFGPKSVENILAAISSSRQCELYSFIAALGIPLIGSTYAKALAKEEATWVEFRDEIKSKTNFTLLDGFGEEMTHSLLYFNYNEADKIAEHLTLVNSLWNDGSDNTTLPLIDKNIVITGKLNIYKNRAALQSAIEAAGGKVVGSVSKNTSYLINNDNTSASAKNMAAKKLDIPVLTEQEFIKKFFENL